MFPPKATLLLTLVPLVRKLADKVTTIAQRDGQSVLMDRACKKPKYFSACEG